jgi:hypothetical protein
MKNKILKFCFNGFHYGIGNFELGYTLSGVNRYGLKIRAFDSSEGKIIFSFPTTTRPVKEAANTKE